MKRLTLLLVFAMIIAIPINATAQSKTKKIEILTNEVKNLRKVVDSLQSIINDGTIQLYDTTGLTDSINVGDFNYEDWPEIEEAEPGCNTDSLLALWYEHRNAPYETVEGIDLDSMNLSSNIPDSIYINKIKRMNSFIPIPYNRVVRNSIILYTEKRPYLAKRILGLSSYYLPIFEEIMDYYGLPKELKAMAIIESALNPFAVSRTKAKGIWQFMYRTALQYDLTINSYVDERLDPVSSAIAAAKYLRDSYTIFGDWPLAIASYNCGSGNVSKAIRRAGGSKEFWSIYPYLPRETRDYIPAFVGALYLLNYYKDYQITPLKFNMPHHVDTIAVNRNLHFDQISHVIGIPVEQLRELNPQYVKDIIPGNEREYILKIPYNFTSSFVDKESEIYAYKDSLYFNPILYNNPKSTIAAESGSGRSWRSPARVTHSVRSGETLNRIAKKYRVSIADIKRWNHLRRDVIQKNQKLVIYKGGDSDTYADNEKDIPDNTSLVPRNSSKTSHSKGYTYYTIRKGDTLLGIANKFSNTSLDELLKMNGLTKHSKIFPGKKLKVKRS